MTISIPVWILWTIIGIVGIPLIVAIFFFAWLGFMVWWNVKDGIM